MFVVATDDFEVYHGVVNELRDRGLTFTTIEPGNPLPDGSAVLIKSVRDEWDPDASTVPVVTAEPGDARGTVDAAVALVRETEGRTIVGVDPGTRPGVAVLSGETVVAVFQVPLEEVVSVINTEIEDAVNPIVRVGDGARISGSRIIEGIDDVRVELVDETGTTPHLGTGARGMGDVLAAVNIAHRSGEPIDAVDVEPTAGEVQVIQNRSRERTGSATLPTELARAVARGELTMAEALAEHQTEGDDADT